MHILVNLSVITITRHNWMFFLESSLVKCKYACVKINIYISILVNTKLYGQVDSLIKDHQSENPVNKRNKTLGVLALITENQKHHDPNILEVLVGSFTWRHTVDGCKILHHQMDG